MKLIDVSEIVFGLVLNKKLLPEQINCSHLASPYDEGMKLLKAEADIAELYDKIGLAAVTAAQQASQVVIKESPLDFLGVLEKAYGREEFASILQRQIKRLERGEDADYSDIERAMERTLTLQHRYTTMDKIDPEKNNWILTGYTPLDEYMGGVPSSNLTIVAASPGSGKTFLALQIALGMARQKKKTLFYTFEMTEGQLTFRTHTLLDKLSKAESLETMQYIEVCADIMDMYEVSAEASRKVALDGVQCIIIDFADLMMQTAEEESNVALLYRTMAALAKKSGVPVILLSQLNRQYAEQGGVPRIHNIRWSGLAEAMAAMIVLIYNPSLTYGAPSSRNTDLQVPADHGALIIGKCRFGYKQGGVGAIIIPWQKEYGWGDKALGWQSMTAV